MEQTALERAPRPLSPLARRAFHPDTVQSGLGVLFCATVPAATLLVPDGLGGPLFAIWMLVPLLLLHTRDHWRVGVAALLGICAAWLTSVLDVLVIGALAM